MQDGLRVFICTSILGRQLWWLLVISISPLPCSFGGMKGEQALRRSSI